jgi:hypothetical protein
MNTRLLYSELASLIQARHNCIKSNNSEWLHNHTTRIQQLIKRYMPSGSGIDCGTKINLDASNEHKLVFTFSFHHMHESGMYDEWTEHKLIVTPSFQGIDLRITGRDRNAVKEYLYETYDYALTREIEDGRTEAQAS